MQKAAVIPHHHIALLIGVGITKFGPRRRGVHVIYKNPPLFIIPVLDAFRMIAQKQAVTTCFGMGAYDGMSDRRNLRLLRVG